MSQRLVIATRNLGKVAEFKRILEFPGLNVLDLSTFPEAPEVQETADTYAGNALLKAQAIAAHTGLPALADDSGLEVDALGGAPGVKSARFAGAQTGFELKLPKLLECLANVPEEKRTARFRCVLCWVNPQANLESPFFTEGLVEGHIAHEPRGQHGFGYDPVFVPQGFQRTMAELEPHQKDALSHRGRALQKMLTFLQERGVENPT